MSEKPEELLSFFSKSEELLEMFHKGKRFTEELMVENDRLRYRMVQQEKESMELSATLTREVERLRLENSQLAQKLEFIEQRFEMVEADSKDFALRYIEVEEQNENLANLYVASYQLHSTLDPVEVVQCIKEILINLIGSEEFGLSRKRRHYCGLTGSTESIVWRGTGRDGGATRGAVFHRGPRRER